MRRFITAIVGAGLALSLPAYAQTSEAENTQLGSRINLPQQAGQTLVDPYDAQQMSVVNQARRGAIFNRFGRCVYDHSHENALAMLERTDYGFVSFDQINGVPSRIARLHGFNNCANSVAPSGNGGLMLRFTPGNLRQWLMQEAYFERYPETPTWIKSGIVIGPRAYPLSEGDSSVLAVMDFADCVVTADPYTADFFYRTLSGSVDEKDAIGKLRPALGSCLAEGQQLELTPFSLRTWLGEALWHAAIQSQRSPSQAQQEVK